jgi:hypothetical protein
MRRSLLLDLLSAVFISNAVVMLFERLNALGLVNREHDIVLNDLWEGSTSLMIINYEKNWLLNGSSQRLEGPGFSLKLNRSRNV